MTEALLDLLPHYGPWLILAVTFLSCLAMPIPASLVMLVAGGFAASGDLSLTGTLAAAFAGAVAGDQVGYQIGRAGGARLLARLSRHPGRAALLARATALIDRRGAIGVFLSRWLFSPLGPTLNFVAGAARMNRARFTRAGVAGEGIWVLLYVGLGYVFAGDILQLSSLLGNASGVLAGLAAVGGLGLWLRAAHRRSAHTRRGKRRLSFPPTRR